MTDATFRPGRRALLAGAAALPLAAGLGASRPAAAGGHSAAPMRSDSHASFTLGDLELTTILAGSRVVEDDPQGTFGMNVEAETFAEVSRENFIPADRTTFFFVPTVVRGGGNVVLFDTGLNAETTVAALEGAGIAAGDVTHVLMTHFHGDHIGGLLTDGAPTYPNAEHVAGRVEMEHWRNSGSESFAANVAPIADRFTLIEDGASPVSGITAMAAFGHTPGHMTYMLSSGDASMLLYGDLANHYVWSLAYPDWEVRFDMDKTAAAQSRRKVLDMLATDRIPFQGYHIPFPSVGYVDARQDSFHFVAETYQLGA